MALIGSIDTGFGTNANYHIITHYRWDKFGDLEVVLSSYVDQPARETAKPINNATLIIRRSDNPTLFMSNGSIPLSDMYDVIKSSIPYNTLTSDE